MDHAGIPSGDALDFVVGFCALIIVMTCIVVAVAIVKIKRQR
jgi:hypothetical protein